MEFLNPALVAPALIIPILAAPIVIHLINLMRHRRVQWAAMEFLLAAHKRTKSWIILKQLLLLLLRVAALACLIFIVARLILPSEWSTVFGGVATHHVILLDDSFSAAEKVGDSTVFDVEKEAVQRIGQRAAGARSQQKITLLRFSRGARPDINEALVDANFATSLKARMDGMGPSQAAPGAAEALDAAVDVLGEPKDEKRIVYIISDFRAREWRTQRT